MATIQEAMTQGATLLEQAVEGTVDAVSFERQLSALLQAPVAARGFMAALSIGTIPQKPEVRKVLLETLRKNKETTYELVLKNIVMPICAAQEHDKQNRPEQAALSRRTCANSEELAALLDDQYLAKMAGNLLIAIEHFPDRAKQATTLDVRDQAEIDKWYEFFERWHYSRESLLAAKDSLTKIAKGA
ncbi:MAG: hypothetical protein KGS72_14505 [Cyanobacteria bacterium REEB67]|nr:hypothetical protein [Cyanobacteria bacterium REEB67]